MPWELRGFSPLPRKVGAGVLAFAVGYVEGFVVGTNGERARIPTARDEAVDDGSGGVVDVDNGNVVVVGVGDEKCFAIGRECECVGCAAFGRIGIERGGDDFARGFDGSFFAAGFDPEFFDSAGSG